MCPQTQADPMGRDRIPMDPELLKAARRGDTSLVENLLARTKIAISAPPDDALSAQNRGASILLGVTIGGNTALHIAATHGHLELAQLIFKKERSLLVARNVMRETPLHCAARAGHHLIVSSIIIFTRDYNGVGEETVLRARSSDWGTALHEAARNGHVEVAKELMSADPGLANMVDEEGISPLYWVAMAGSLPLLRAILPSSSTTPSTASSFPVSYAGPNGQTALHAAAFTQNNSEIAKELLEWNPMLAKRADNSGRTPFHHAALVGNDEIVGLLLKHDISLAYIADLFGLFPVHIAAITGKVSVIDKLLEHCPDSDELLDNKGWNLLHTAVEHKRIEIVRYVCKRSELTTLMNHKDYEGNTPLHLAVRKGEQGIVSLLIRNKTVNLNTRNKEGLTPLDLSIIGVECGLNFFMNPSNWILWCLKGIGARASSSVDHSTPKMDSEKESRKSQQLSQSLIITSVLIATVTFAGAFTLPGGFSDDGTPTLAWRYTFKAHVIADALAFILSLFSTFLNIHGGTEMTHPGSRNSFLALSYVLVVLATESLVAAFASGIRIGGVGNRKLGGSICIRYISGAGSV
ncbi:protein ACCELERATED CELL DEATH 6-like [Typha angustifolia]|uniref:protein ACCELERATED CELL DEATH 6-like n=1 Tax=Typha angustifolia TaxID=59011 RepID=UPI003C2C7381